MADSIKDIDWRQEMLRRKKEMNVHYKEIRSIEKKISKLGTTNGLEYIAEQIESTYDMPCRIKWRGMVKQLVLYKKSATKKQIQYNRPECIVGALRVEGVDEELFVEVDYGCFIPMPDTISGVLELLKSGAKII